MTQFDVLDGEAFSPWVFTASQLYGEAMRRPPEYVLQRREIMQSHLHRRGFVAVVAVDDDELIGFGYGYRGRAGEWWHDVVAAALGPQVTADYLSDGFELAELHVTPARQREGIGRTMLDRLLEAAGDCSVVLSTHDVESPARHLYRSRGFVDLLGGFVFPGSIEVYAVMGRRP